MAAMAGLLNHAATAGQALSGTSATPTVDAATGSSSNSSNSSTTNSSGGVSANDFLTLLVTEMRNQDPTANTDPNEYINQLVQVNSLEQLIDINQTLAAAIPPANTTSTPVSDQSTGAVSGVTGTANPSSGTNQAQAAVHQTGALSAAQSAVSGMMGNAASAQGLKAKQVPGNLSVPDANPGAQRVGHALDGKTHRRWIGGAQPGV